jgi:aromatic ring-opening dioxygenase catalytic subunit (LigB family)
MRWPTLFICHGGGPWPFMDQAEVGRPAMWGALDVYLRSLDASLGARPKAVLAISGHWEEGAPTVNAGARPPMLYDYYGFPPHTYTLVYPAPGAPELAARVRERLASAGIPSGEETARGFDHGVFIPFMLIYPEADVPILQLSLKAGLDPAAHLAIGRALAPLRDEDVLIVGSGLSFHNLRALFVEDPRAIALAEQFDAWLAETCEAADAAERDRRLAGWAGAPGARFCHPREEHLLPLMVAAGAAGKDAGRRAYAERVLGKPMSGFQFG